MTFRKVPFAMSLAARSRSLLAGTVLLLCGAPGIASAGTYTHVACGSADVADGTSGWFAVQAQVPAGSTQAANNCAAGGGLSAQIMSSDAVGVNPGDGVGWRYVPPTGTRIQSAALTVQGWGTVFWDMATQFVLSADAEREMQAEMKVAN